MYNLNDQEILDKASELYFHAESTIKALDAVFIHAMKNNMDEESAEKLKDFDPETTLATFDLILQGVLLSVALADGELTPVEQNFIEQFTIHADLLAFIEADMEEKIGEAPDLSWDFISRLDDESRNKILTILPAVLDDACKVFVFPLTTADVVYSMEGKVQTPRGIFLKSIENDMVGIADLLASVDKQYSAEERSAGAKMIFELEGRHWRDILSDPDFFGDSSISSSNSDSE